MDPLGMLAAVVVLALVVILAAPQMATSAPTPLGLWPHVGSGELHYVPFDSHATAWAADDAAGPVWKAPWPCRIVKAFASGSTHTAQTTVATDIDVIFVNQTTTTTIATVPLVNGSALVDGGAYADPASAAASLIAEDDVVERTLDFTGGSGTQTLANPRSGLWLERLSPGV